MLTTNNEIYIYFTVVQEKIAKNVLQIYDAKGVELEDKHQKQYVEEVGQIGINIEKIMGNDDLKSNLTKIYKENVCKHALLVAGLDPPPPCELSLLNSGLETVLMFVAQKVVVYARKVGKLSPQKILTSIEF